MKRFVAALIGAALIAGCSTTGTPDKQQTCETATIVYAGYLAVINADGEPSKDQALAAAAAAEFLRAYCGWTAPKGATARTFDGEVFVPTLLPPR